MNKNLTIEEQNNQILHNQEVIIKFLDQIKKHLWVDDQGEHGLKEPANNRLNDSVDYQEEQAVNYVHNVLIPDLAKKEAEKGDMVAEGVWIEWVAKPVIEFLKTQALTFIGKTLIELKDQLLPIAVDIADWALEQLENLILKQYQKASETAQKLFKDKIREKFPNSRLLGKL
jgi:hypothetical protein